MICVLVDGSTDVPGKLPAIILYFLQIFANSVELTKFENTNSLEVYSDFVVEVGGLLL